MSKSTKDASAIPTVHEGNVNEEVQNLKALFRRLRNRIIACKAVVPLEVQIIDFDLSISKISDNFDSKSLLAGLLLKRNLIDYCVLGNLKNFVI